MDEIRPLDLCNRLFHRRALFYEYLPNSLYKYTAFHQYHLHNRDSDHILSCKEPIARFYNENFKNLKIFNRLKQCTNLQTA